MRRDSWWLDYIENELDPSTRAEMKSILRHSAVDQDLVKSLSDTKYLIKEHADKIPELSDDFFDQMHDKIMAQVEKTEIKKSSRYRLRPVHKRLVKTASAGLVLAAAAFTGVRYLAHQEVESKWDISQQMAQHAFDDPDELAHMMTFQNEHDFLVDVATLSLDHLSKEQFESLLKTTKTR